MGSEMCIRDSASVAFFRREFVRNVRSRPRVVQGNVEDRAENVGVPGAGAAASV